MRPLLACLLSFGLLGTASATTHPRPSISLSRGAISPNGDGRADDLRIRVEAAPAVAGLPVTVTVRILQGTRVWKTWPASVSRFDHTWDGRDDLAALVPDGAYTIEARASDGVSDTVSTRSLAVDTRPPSARLLGVARSTRLRGGPLRFVIQATDRAPQLRAELHVADALGPVTRSVHAIRSGKTTVAWRPRYRHGPPLYPGNHRARVLVMDDAGNVSRAHAAGFRLERRVRGRVYKRLSGAGRTVAITIDDCHFGRPWKRMLDTLRAMDAKATFFCPGDRMLLFKGLVRRTVREGHLLASHGWDHANLAGRSRAATFKRVRRDANTAWSLARVTTAPYVRPPYGSYDATMVRAAGATGHGRVILWDVDSGDTRGVAGSQLVRNSVGPARGGSIILMHTLDRTAAALPAIIRGLRGKGLRPVLLTEMFRLSGRR